MSGRFRGRIDCQAQKKSDNAAISDSRRKPGRQGWHVRVFGPDFGLLMAIGRPYAFCKGGLFFFYSGDRYA